MFTLSNVKLLLPSKTYGGLPGLPPADTATFGQVLHLALEQTDELLLNLRKHLSHWLTFFGVILDE